MNDFRYLVLAILAFALPGFATSNEPPQLNNPAMEVRVEDNVIIVNVSFLVPATLTETWAVLTDYDHMADFLPYVEQSKVISGTNEQFLVEQNGKVFLGPFSFSYESIREVTLIPHQEIRYRLISGNFRKLNGQTQLISSGDETLIVHYGESIPIISMPRSIVVAMTKRATLDQLENIKREILKRKNEPQK